MAGLTLLCAALSCSPRTARACSPPGVPSIALNIDAVPVDAAITGIVADCGGCSLQDLYVERIGGARVAGRLLDVRSELAEKGWIAFQPDQPLEAGARYVIHVPHAGNEYATEVAAFEAVAATSVQPMSSAAYPSVKQQGLDAVECGTYDGSVGGLCSRPVFYENSFRYAALRVSATGAGVGEHAFRVAWRADGEEVDQQRAQAGAVFDHTFLGTSRSVCYELFALPLFEGGERRVGGECFSTADDNLGKVEGIFGNQDETLLSCEAPPTGYEEAWCRAIRASGRLHSDALSPTVQKACDGDEVADEDSLGLPREDDSGCQLQRANGVRLTGVAWGVLAAVFTRRRRSRAVAR